MKKTATTKGTKRSLGISAFPIIILCFILAMVIYHFVYGNPANFINNDPNNHPLPGNLLGTIYKGGVIVPIIQTLLFTVLTLSVERMLALRKAKGKKNLQQFVTKVKDQLEQGDIEAARQACDEQKGTVANVIKASLSTYTQVKPCRRKKSNWRSGKIWKRQPCLNYRPWNRIWGLSPRLLLWVH